MAFQLKHLPTQQILNLINSEYNKLIISEQKKWYGFG